MKSFTVFLIAFLAVTVWAVTAGAQATTCTNVSGKILETVLPNSAAPNDPFGRVLGTVTGRLLGGSATSIITTPPIRFPVSTIDTFLTDSGVLVATGSAFFTPLPTILPNGPTLVWDDLTLTIVSGTGDFKGATGTITARGIGVDLAPGQGRFNLDYTGQVCIPK